MPKEVRFAHHGDKTKDEITLKKLIIYNLLFFVPVGIAFFISTLLARITYQYLESSTSIAIHLFMMIFVFLIFFFTIPLIRRKENVKGVRYALFGFFIVTIGLSIPSIIVERNLGFLFNLFNHIATYVLLTFIYCPEVLGMDINLSKWFKNYKQMLIVLVYVTIVTLYVLGFGWQYTVMYNDHGEQAFAIGFDKPVTYGTFIYYSIVSFTTIGYGEITPLSTAARLFTGVQAMLGMIINVVFVAILLLYISNFQAFIKAEQEEHIKEEKEIRALRKAITKKKSR